MFNRSCLKTTFFQSEANYEKWQLLENPLSLDQFNSLPMLTSMFFEYSLALQPDLPSPIIVHENAAIVISAWEAVRYKFKFFPVNKVKCRDMIWYEMSFIQSLKLHELTL